MQDCRGQSLVCRRLRMKPFLSPLFIQGQGEVMAVVVHSVLLPPADSTDVVRSDFL